MKFFPYRRRDNLVVRSETTEDPAWTGASSNVESRIFRLKMKVEVVGVNVKVE
jgi:hypothetical protein